MAEYHHNLSFRKVDDFVLQELIYEGPHTLVFKGVQESLERVVIIKLLKPHVKNREEWVERFKREARACAKLKHPNIVDVYALGEKDGYHYIASEYVNGMSLKDLLKVSGSLPLNIALSITQQVLQALSFVHQNQIVHRDIKPGNILIDLLGQAKLTDFGLAQIEEEPTVTQQGSIIGTPAYMAPEQITGNSIDGRADLFAFGAVLYEMLSGEQAFAGENYSTCLYKIINEQPPPLTQVQTGIPEDIVRFQEKFLQKLPEQRWKDSPAAHTSLQKLLKPLNLEVETEQVAEFIRPLVPPSSGKIEKAGVSTEVKFPGGKPGANKRSITLRRRVLFNGGLGVAALIIVFLIWLQMTADSTIRSENSHNSVSLSLMDSLRSDSITPSINHTDSLGNIEPVRHSAKGGDKQTGNQALKLPNVAIRRDTLPGATAYIDSPALKDTLPDISATEANPAAQLNIQVEPWAKIIIDDREAGSHVAQQSIPVEPGKHTVTFLHPNFSPQVMQIEVQTGEQKKLHWSFLENAGFLWVEVRPWADIFIDNKFRDTTPLDHPIVLSTGEHLLELKHPQLSPYRERIKIQLRDTLQVQVVLKSK